MRFDPSGSRIPAEPVTHRCGHVALWHLAGTPTAAETCRYLAAHPCPDCLLARIPLKRVWPALVAGQA